MKKIGTHKMLTALTDQHHSAALMLTKYQKKQEKPTLVELSVVSCRGVLQKSVAVG